MTLRRTSGNQQKISKAPDGWYPSSTKGTLKSLSTYLPLTLTISPAALLSISLTPQTWSLQTRMQADVHGDIMPLRWGVMSGFSLSMPILSKVISSEVVSSVQD